MKRGKQKSNLNLRSNHEIGEETSRKSLPIKSQSIQNETVGKPIVVHDQCTLGHNPGSKTKYFSCIKLLCTHHRYHNI